MAAVNPATIDNAVIDALVDGTHAQPHEVLGPHIADGTVTIRVLRPNATSVDMMLGGERIRVWQATNPQPSATSTAAPGTIVRADDAGIVVCCGEYTLSLEVLQLEGGRALSAQELLRAHQAKFAPGRRFDLPSASAG